MPRKQLKTSGYFGPKPHPYHQHWQFTFCENNTGYEDMLDNEDLELCPVKNRIKICQSSILLYIGEKASSVTVYLHLPVEVTMIVIHKFGHYGKAFCFATVAGHSQPTVLLGNMFKKDPHAKRLGY